jgi:biopolymer transport protein ExbB
VLVRLHEGVFSFMSSKEDGSDLRFTADDHKTVLKHHVEKWDSLLNEAYVWVQVPDLKPAAATAIWLYYGNTTEAVAVDPAKESYDENTVLAYHFADASKAGTDSSATGANAEGTPPPAAGSLIGGGLRVFGQTPIKVNAPPLPEWAPGAPLRVSVWVKPSAWQPNAVILRRRDGANNAKAGADIHHDLLVRQDRQAVGRGRHFARRQRAAFALILSQHHMDAGSRARIGQHQCVCLLRNRNRSRRRGVVRDANR